MLLKKLITMSGILLIVIASVIFIGWQPATKDFTEKDITDIKASLKTLKASDYRIVLPVIKDNKQVGTETLGTLPVSQVRLIASAKKITYTSEGNLQIVVENSGGGSHTPSCTPCKGKGLDVITRLDKVVKNFDKSKYILIR